MTMLDECWNYALELLLLLPPRALCCEGMVSSFEDRIAAAFADADAGGSGRISKRELRRGLERLGLKPTPRELLDVWRQFDRDADGAPKIIPEINARSRLIRTG